MKKLLLALLLLPIIAAAQDLTGDWTALLHYSAQIKDKSVVLHFSRSRNGTLAGNLRGTSPVFFIAVDSIVVRDGQVGFKISTGSAMATHSTNFDPLAGVTVQGRFRGILDPGGSVIYGIWTQTEPLPFRPIEVDFRRVGAPVTQAQPQPQPQPARPLPGFDPLPSAPACEDPVGGETEITWKFARDQQPLGA